MFKHIIKSNISIFKYPKRNINVKYPKRNINIKLNNNEIIDKLNNKEIIDKLNNKEIIDKLNKIIKEQENSNKKIVKEIEDTLNLLFLFNGATLIVNFVYLYNRYI
jgi:CRISPR/Cas system CMR subunit Cmr6 (Cas7 group RAMP superfamily)